MNALTDFAALMNDIRAHQQELGALLQKITRPDEKEMMAKLISEIDNARQQAETVVPNTLQMIKDSATQTAEQARQHLAELDQQAQQAQPAAAVATARIPSVESVEKAVRVDPKLGSSLRDELLQRFAASEDRGPHADPIREAWEDWQ